MRANELHACLKRLNALPMAAKQEWANRIIYDSYLRQGRVSAPIKSLLIEVLSGLPTFKFNPNHDPENGQFTSGAGNTSGIDDPPIQPVYPIETALATLTVGEGLAVMKGLAEAEEGVAEAVSGPVENAMQSIEDYLGGTPDQTITNPSGDVVVMKGENKIRFDINNSGNDDPHFHVETQNSNGRWIDAGEQHRYYFQGKE